MQQIEGSCLCEKIQFKFSPPITWAGHCHCTQCQKVSGSAFMTWVNCRKENYEITDPENLLSLYDSGLAKRGFCKNCGSSFFFTYNLKEYNKERSQYVFFSRSNIQNLDKIEYQHIYFDCKASWFSINDSLQKISEANCY